MDLALLPVSKSSLLFEFYANVLHIPETARLIKLPHSLFLPWAGQQLVYLRIMSTLDKSAPHT